MPIKFLAQGNNMPRVNFMPQCVEGIVLTWQPIPELLPLLSPIYIAHAMFFCLVSQIQFFVGMVYGIQGIIVDCDYPRWMMWTSMAYGVSIITLFLNFYIQAYIKKPKLQVMNLLFFFNPVCMTWTFLSHFRFSSMWAYFTQFNR